MFLVGKTMPKRITAVPRRFETQAQRLIRERLWQQGKTYRQLAELLSAHGVALTRDNLVNKISRGRFSAGFLLLCLEVLGETGATP